MLEKILEKFMDNYKILILIPVIVTILSLALVSFNGLEEGIELKGGSIAVLKLDKPISSPVLENQIRTSLNNHNITVQEVDVISTRGTDVTIQLGTELNSSTFNNVIGNIANVTSYNAVGPVLSEEAMTQTYWALGFAFLFMSISVFVVFREPIPTIGIILGAASDIIIAVGAMSLFNIPLSIASVGALLMLIAYSIDTDIVLTTRIVRRKEGTIVERAIDAMKTGMTMSITAIASMVVLYTVVVILIPEASVLSDIAAVLIVGLCADIFTTWFMNLGILRWYVEARQ